MMSAAARSTATVLLTALLAAAAAPAQAQGFAMSKAGDQQIQVYADNGIEWLSEELRVIARGNAKAIRGTMTVDSDVLTAHYRKGAKGDEIWRLDADGAVVIRSPTDTATGHKGIYDLDKALFVLKGTPATLVTPTDRFQASESLEYYELERMAVLRGDAVAVAVQDGRTLRADILTAHFKDRAAAGAAKPARPRPGSGQGSGDDGGLDLRRVDAYGHVHLTTATETVTGDRGDYDADSGIATVSGAVRITREGGNQLEGGWAYVNMNTGVSKLFPNPPGKSGESSPRVQGVFVPQKRAEPQADAPQGAPAPQGRASFTGRVPAGNGEEAR